MATTYGVSDHKINPEKLSFFDLPVEVREKVYEEYFALPEHLTIHLIHGPSKKLHKTDTMRVSTVHHNHLPSANDYESDPFDVYDGPICVEDLLTSAPQSNLVWSNLESTTRTLSAEASKYSYRDTRFTILGGGNYEYHSLYHHNVGAVPKRLCSKIKNLELGGSILESSFKGFWKDGWTSGVWPILLTDMVNLQHLHFDAPCCTFQLLKLLTMGQAYFLGPRPKVSFEINSRDRIEYCWSFDMKKYGATLPLMPRFIVPPLKTITFSGESLPKFNNAEGWSESRLKLIKSMPRTPRGVLRVYELTWPEDDTS